MMPTIVRLRRMCESFLYESKNYLRDLLGVLNFAYGCQLQDASDFTDLKSKGESNVVKWAAQSLGTHHPLTEMLRHEAPWTGELIRKRNAVEHPGGFSGELLIRNIEWHPTAAGKFIPPTWHRTNEPESDVASDMKTCLSNMLTLAEDILAAAIVDKPTFKRIAIYEISEKERDPDCPVRLRVNLSPEMLEKLPAADRTNAAAQEAKAKDGNDPNP